MSKGDIIVVRAAEHHKCGAAQQPIKNFHTLLYGCSVKLTIYTKQKLST
jgi:hypothetical protein